MGILTTLTNFGGRALYTIRRNKSKIELAAGGILIFTGAAVIAKEAMTKCPRHLEAKKIDDECLLGLLNDPDAAIGEKEYKRGLRKNAASMIFACVKDCGPGLAVVAAGFGCCTLAYIDERAAKLGAIALAAEATSALDTYRGRVIEEDGVEKDRHYMGLDKDPGDISPAEDGDYHLDDDDKYLEPEQYIGTNPGAMIFNSQTSGMWSEDLGKNLDTIRYCFEVINRNNKAYGWRTRNDIRESLAMHRIPDPILQTNGFNSTRHPEIPYELIPLGEGTPDVLINFIEPPYPLF